MAAQAKNLFVGNADQRRKARERSTQASLTPEDPQLPESQIQRAGTSPELLRVMRKALAKVRKRVPLRSKLFKASFFGYRRHPTGVCMGQVTRVFKGVLLCVFVLGCTGAIVAADQRVKKVVHLENGLEVMLISDPKVTISSAAIDVEAGSLDDPDEFPGMAHFCEHAVLMTGNSKYPEPTEFDGYIQKHQGSSRAHTNHDNTNYYFEVANDALEGALDRLAHSFIAPLLTESELPKQLIVLNSENEHDRENDYWRRKTIEIALGNPKHRENRFSVGSSTSLRDVKAKDIRTFLEKHYSANLIKAVIVGSAPLTELELIAVRTLGQIVNRNRTRSEHGWHIANPLGVPQAVAYRTLHDARNLLLSFDLPPLASEWRSRPDVLIGAYFGTDEAGSLSSFLRRRGWITELLAGITNESRHYGDKFTLSLALTPEGSEHWQEVITAFFAWANLARNEEIKVHLFENEKQRLFQELTFMGQAERQGEKFALRYAEQMTLVPAMEVEPSWYTIERYSPQLLRQLLEMIQPYNMVAILGDPELEGEKLEPIYGVPYRIFSLTPELIESWRTAKPGPEFSYPIKNPYFSVDYTRHSDPSAFGKPKLTFSDDHTQIYVHDDPQFSEPKSYLNIELVTNSQRATPRDHALFELYQSLLSRHLLDETSLMRQAGYKVDVKANTYGVAIGVSGLSEKIPTVLEKLRAQIGLFKLDEAELAQEKVSTIEALNIVEFGGLSDSDSVASRIPERIKEVLSSHCFLPTQIAEAIPAITGKELQAFADGLYQNLGFRVLAVGNFDPDWISQGLPAYLKSWGAGPVPLSKIGERQYYKLGPGKHACIARSLPTGNHIWQTFRELGPFGPKNRAIQLLASAYLDVAFFDEFLNKRNLGYTVWTYPDNLWSKTCGYGSYVDSDHVESTEIAAVCNDWLKKRVGTLESWDDQSFEEHRKGLLERFTRPHASLDEVFEEDQDLLIRLGGDFAFKEKVVAEIKATSKNEVAESLVRTFDPAQSGTFSFYYGAEGSAVQNPPESQVTDLEAFKKSLEKSP